MLKLPHTRSDAAGAFSGDKIIWHGEVLNALREGRIPPPVTVEIDPTNGCNLACSFCTNSVYRQEAKASLPSELLAETIDSLADIGTKAVTFTGGGEPTLRDDLPQHIFHASKRGMKVGLVTNGVRLQNPPPGMLETIVNHTTWVRVSLDACDAEEFLSRKGQDKFDAVIQGIINLLVMREKQRGKTTIGVGYLTDSTIQFNWSALLRRIAAWPHRPDYIQFRPAIFMPSDNRITDQTSPDIITAAIQFGRSLGLNVTASIPKYDDVGKPRGYGTCFGVYTSCVIGATGDVWVCCHARGISGQSLGNINVQSFPSIWFDAASRNLVYGNIDLSKCMPLCRFHPQNKLLNQLSWFPTHIEFL